jgi:hypothetical protein
MNPDSYQIQTPPDPTTDVTIVSFEFLAARVANARTEFLFLSLTLTAKRDGHCLPYYVQKQTLSRRFAWRE